MNVHEGSPRTWNVTGTVICLLSSGFVNDTVPFQSPAKLRLGAHPVMAKITIQMAIRTIGTLFTGILQRTNVLATA